ncbi:Y-family DNA polymerase [Rhodovulum sulfidophilum]|uniref:Y-family DNA polymerase n=1 Tax=Rhodovulum sulfidophilum TaxID=35806 RepID=UPI00138A5C3E|nr:DNA polymerase Y family protein [Rhodovulum sulfidophilum]NDK34782.1 DNA polymerase Y family protein [Rhodovulum sulfidophilum]
MFDGMHRRIVSIWFPRLASDRALRLRPVEAPFALSLTRAGSERIHCLNLAAVSRGLHRGMGLADARALCPDLLSRPADPAADARFLRALCRWATRYCPWAGIEGEDGLVLDITGAAHLFGGEAEMLADMRARLLRAGIAARLGLAATRGAAWALARHGEGVAAPGADPLQALGHLPVRALRLEEDTAAALDRLGLRSVADLAARPRAPLARRFGPELLKRLDQALGAEAEAIAPVAEPPHYAVRLSLPDPIGLVSDVMAGTGRLLEALCARLKDRQDGARVLRLTLNRVDGDSRQVELRLARPLHEPARILPLFERGVAGVEAGFGIDRLRLEAVQVEPLPPCQTGFHGGDRTDGLDDLISRIGTRIGLENIRRFLPADSHIPERSFLVASAAWSEPGGAWIVPHPRPLRLFPPEPIAGTGPQPPGRFRWRRMTLETARATGPERIAPEWWLEDEAWRSGLRDYWRIETRQGRRLWLFHTPQAPGWFVQGEFA